MSLSFVALTITIVLTAVVASILQELVTLGAAWLAGVHDPRMRPLAHLALRRSSSLVGWLLLPLGLALLTQLQLAALPVWAYGRPLFAATITSSLQRRRWVMVQLAIIPVLVLLAALVSLLLPLAGGLPLSMLGTVVKQLLFLSLLHLVPVPPFAMGRALSSMWGDRRLLTLVQGLLFSALLVDGLTGGHVIGSTLGVLVDMFVATLRILS